MPALPNVPSRDIGLNYLLFTCFVCNVAHVKNGVIDDEQNWPTGQRREILMWIKKNVSSVIHVSPVIHFKGHCCVQEGSPIASVWQQIWRSLWLKTLLMNHCVVNRMLRVIHEEDYLLLNHDLMMYSWSNWIKYLMVSQQLLNDQLKGETTEKQLR